MLYYIILYCTRSPCLEGGGARLKETTHAQKKSIYIYIYIYI